MYELLITIGLAWLVSSAGNFEILLNGNHRRKLAAAALCLGFGLAVYSAVQSWQLNHSKTVERTGDDTKDLVINEASGGAVLHKTAYVVDDEEPGLFVSSQLDETKGVFAHFSHRTLIKDGTPMTKDHVNDLEGVAVDPVNNKLYLVTSHSDNKNKNKDKRAGRSKLLRLDLTSMNDSSIRVEAEVALRQALENRFWPAQQTAGQLVAAKSSYPVRDGFAIAQVESVMEIEGLALDNQQRLYLGFRTPACQDGRALIVSADADVLFAGEVSADMFNLHCVGVGDSNEGIISMEFDATAGSILVLTGSPNPYIIKNPRLCHWSDRSGNSDLEDCKNMPKLNDPAAGKQEAMLLVRAAELLVTVLDTDERLGGQVSYSLSEVGVTPAKQ